METALVKLVSAQLIQSVQCVSREQYAGALSDRMIRGLKIAARIVSAGRIRSVRRSQSIPPHLGDDFGDIVCNLRTVRPHFRKLGLGDEVA